MPAAAGRLAGGPRARTICLLQTNTDDGFGLLRGACAADGATRKGNDDENRQPDTEKD